MIDSLCGIQSGLKVQSPHPAVSPQPDCFKVIPKALGFDTIVDPDPKKETVKNELSLS